MGQACGHSILCRSQQYPAARPAEPRGQQVFLKPDEPPPQPCADSLQPARTPLHRSQNPQGVETTDWRMLC
uniref:Phosphodiesterase 2A, cGMP-stimulated n=1 Tax=Mus musculus TaxID=10090 RepID=A0A1B0GT58_MOUSE